MKRDTEHERTGKILDAYADGELSASETKSVEAHLTRCPECRARLEEWKQIRTAFFSPPEEKPSPALVVRVMNALEPEPVTFGSVIRWLAPTLAAAAVALFAVSAWPVDDSDAFEINFLNKANPWTIQEVAMNTESDWTGWSAL
jgi:anti-sigma factor RsiW